MYVFTVRALMFLVCKFIIRMSRSCLYIKVIGSRSEEQRMRYTSVTKYRYLQVVHLRLKDNIVS